MIVCYIYGEIKNHMKKKRPEFYVMYKDFNWKKIRPVEVLSVVFDEMFNPKGSINKRRFVIYDKQYHPIPVRTKEQLKDFIEDQLRYRFWSNASWEMVLIDWPYGNTIEDSNPVKVDLWDLIEPNMPVITDLVWDYVKDKVEKLAKKDNE